MNVLQSHDAAGRKLFLSPRFGVLVVCLPPRSLKKPRPKEERAFLVPKLSSLAMLDFIGEEEASVLLLACEEKKS